MTCVKQNGWSRFVSRIGFMCPKVKDELGAAHGEFTLSREYIESMLRSTIDEEFLTLD